ncbi:Cell division and transport-associated protein TolA [Halopseudomonas xinjiangensis]|uniref:Cell division and transport-associated protein TolA n=1 Tax=Halopseudomonas xinjiangensis TaxID=487184 RepID=A0A1H1UI51_9GAMM|nr:cell envelope integrity protein TolA [Halopseudomonas xinjiangensis]SDS71951.1 Cell division and transport-associated protein TolA [Halopseudomonas xinjiangensis]
MNTREDQPRESGSGRYAAPAIKAVALHAAVAALLFVSFSSAPEFEPAKPIVQARLVQLNSKSPATTQTNQRIAGEAERTAAPTHEAEELERKKAEQQEAQEAASRAAAEKARQEAAAAAQAERQKQVAAARAEAEKTAKEKAEAEAKRQADIARKRAEEEAKKKAAAAEAAKNKAAEEAKRKAAEEAKKKAAEDAKRKAAEQAKKEAEADRIAREKREQEQARAKALSELLAEETQYQRAQADQIGDEVAASYDDVIRRYVSEQWRRPPTARNGMVVEVRISMLPTGQITDVVVTRSSGDAGFDQSAVQAVKNVGRIPEMQQLSRENPATFDREYRNKLLRFRPEDLSF